MKLKISQYKVDGVFKTLVIDLDRTKTQGRLLYIAESIDRAISLIDANEFKKQYLKSGVSIWN